MDTRKLVNIKAGQFVWLGDNFNERREVKKVARVTPTLIVVGEGKMYCERLYRTNGYQQGRGWNSTRITAVATAEDAKRQRIVEKRQAYAERIKERKQEKMQAKSKNLGLLFGRKKVGVYVNDSDSKFTVTFNSLSEAAVKKLAKMIVTL
jgi:hypothetical protein